MSWIPDPDSDRNLEAPRSPWGPNMFCTGSRNVDILFQHYTHTTLNKILVNGNYKKPFENLYLESV